MLSRKLAIALFTIWFVCLTGLLGILFKSPALPPGIYQALQLKALLNDRRVQLASLRQELDALAAQEQALRFSRAHQEREIRRVLGYTATDEIVFDFSE